MTMSAQKRPKNASDDSLTRSGPVSTVSSNPSTDGGLLGRPRQRRGPQHQKAGPQRDKDAGQEGFPAKPENQCQQSRLLYEKPRFLPKICIYNIVLALIVFYEVYLGWFYSNFDEELLERTFAEKDLH